MSRRHRAEKREILPDPKFGNVVVTKFMNSVMHAGKKSVAEMIVYGALDMIEGKTRQSPVSDIPAGARQRHAVDRSAFAPRRRRHLSGAGRGAYFAASGARHPLDHCGGARAQRENDDRAAIRASCSTRRTTGGTP